MSHEQLMLANQMLQQNQPAEARTILKRLVKNHGSHPDLLTLSAQAEHMLGNEVQAIALLRQVNDLVPGNYHTMNNLAQALMLSNEGRNTIAAIDVFAQMLKRAPEDQLTATHLAKLALRNDLPQAVLQSIPATLQHDILPSNRLRLHAAMAIAAYLMADFESCANHAAQALLLRDHGYAAEQAGQPDDLPHVHLLIYAQFLVDLHLYRQANPAYYHAPQQPKKIHVIGESHSLTPAHLVLGDHQVTSHLMMGGLAYYFTVPRGQTWQYTLEQRYKTIRKDEPVMVCFGEIDCRSNGGIMAQYLAQPGYDLAGEINQLVEAYVRFVKKAQLRRAARTWLCNVPAPKRSNVTNLDEHQCTVFTSIIARFNQALQRETEKQELGLVDVYTPSVGHDGWACEGAHIDEVHLTPAILAQAMQVCL